MSGAVIEAVSGDGRKGFSGRFKDTHRGGDGSLLTRPPKVAGPGSVLVTSLLLLMRWAVGSRSGPVLKVMT